SPMAPAGGRYSPGNGPAGNRVKPAKFRLLAAGTALHGTVQRLARRKLSSPIASARIRRRQCAIMPSLGRSKEDARLEVHDERRQTILAAEQRVHGHGVDAAEA